MPNSSDFNRFSVNPTNIDISRSLFNMNHSVKWSADIGECIPFDCLEVLPGDTFTVDTSKVIRLQPLVAPIMDEVILDTYWFFVPNRLVWSHWINFMGENTESAWAPQVEYSIPTLTPPTIDEASEKRSWNVGTIADYLGLPVNDNGQGNQNEYNALPFRAYALIMDQWFRSEAVMDPVHVFVDDVNREGSNGSDQVSDIELGGKPFIACKFFDYFTSCLPSPQRGDPVSIKAIKPEYLQVLPYRTDLIGTTYRTPYKDSKIRPGKYFDENMGSLHFSYVNYDYPHSTFGTFSAARNDLINSDGNLSFDPNSTPTDYKQYGFFPDNLFVPLNNSNLQSISINDLRLAFAMQKYLEKQARYGGRYQEFIKGFFNVDSPDARLQRSEYLGGSRLSLNINSVEQTSATTSETTPLGNVAGMSVTGDNHSDFTKSFTEHGYIIGIAVARYHHSYQDSTHKMWSRKTPYEFYNPVFANLGEQAVLKKELCGYVHVDTIFGYQERWAEYRYQPSRVCGEMRSVYSTPLDMWHLGDHYSTSPSLSPEWLREDKTNLDRCLAVTSDVSNQLICDFYVEMEASRPMPLYSIPGLIDHH